MQGGSGFMHTPHWWTGQPPSQLPLQIDVNDFELFILFSCLRCLRPAYVTAYVPLICSKPAQLHCLRQIGATCLRAYAGSCASAKSVRVSGACSATRRGPAAREDEAPCPNPGPGRLSAHRRAAATCVACQSPAGLQGTQVRRTTPGTRPGGWRVGGSGSAG